MEVSYRFLGPDDAELLPAVIREAYGESYDLDWVYDVAEVRQRLADGRYTSMGAFTEEKLVCHGGMSRAAPDDRVGHSGQAVTLKEARGRHLYSEVKQRLVEYARDEGWAGLYSEAVAVHPYSQKAILNVGSIETGVLLGWIPRSVSNDAAAPAAGATRPNRQSAVLFYKKTNDGHERPIYAPDHYRGMIEQVTGLAQLRGHVAEVPGSARLEGKTSSQTHHEPRHNLAIIHVDEPGADLVDSVRATRHHLFHSGVDAVYIDLPLETPATALVTDHLKELGASFAGVFPNTRADGDVLRLQSLHKHCVDPGEIQVASPHGEELLEFVLQDLDERL